MKKTCVILIETLMLSTNVFADTSVKKLDTNTKAVAENSSADYTDAEPQYVDNAEYQYLDDYMYEENSNPSFFLGLETPIFSYGTNKISDTVFNESVETESVNLNRDVLDNLSFVFGVEIESFGRALFLMSQTSTETGDMESTLMTSSLRFDISPFKYNKPVTPFLRLGIGYLKATEDDETFSAMMYAVGLGVNYRINKNLFSYVALQYSFLPETSIGDSTFKYQEKLTTLSLGFGYKF